MGSKKRSPRCDQIQYGLNGLIKTLQIPRKKKDPFNNFTNLFVWIKSPGLETSPKMSGCPHPGWPRMASPRISQTRLVHWPECRPPHHPRSPAKDEARVPVMHAASDRNRHKPGGCWSAKDKSEASPNWRNELRGHVFWDPLTKKKRLPFFHIKYASLYLLLDVGDRGFKQWWSWPQLSFENLLVNRWSLLQFEGFYHSKPLLESTRGNRYKPQLSRDCRNYNPTYPFIKAIFNKKLNGTLPTDP